VLAFVYIFLIAKPISIRRLSLLFVLVLMSATSILGIFRVQHSTSYGLAIAASVAALVWTLPLVRVLQDTIRLGMLSLDALVPVSGVVRWTYGFALLTVPLLAIGYLLDLLHYRAPTVVPCLIVIAGLLALILQLPLHASGVQDARRSPREHDRRCRANRGRGNPLRYDLAPACPSNRRYWWPR